MLTALVRHWFSSWQISLQCYGSPHQSPIVALAYVLWPRFPMIDHNVDWNLKPCNQIIAVRHQSTTGLLSCSTVMYHYLVRNLALCTKNVLAIKVLCLINSTPDVCSISPRGGVIGLNIVVGSHQLLCWSPVIRLRQLLLRGQRRDKNGVATSCQCPKLADFLPHNERH